MDAIRRDFLKFAGAGLTGFAVPAVAVSSSWDPRGGGEAMLASGGSVMM